MKNLVPDNVIADWFNVPVVDKPYIYLNRWSAVHLGSGVLIAKYVDWKKALGVFVAWEIFELMFQGVAFKKETKTDIAWDIIMGMAGFGLSKLISKNI